MHAIDEATVEETWRDVSAMGTEEAAGEMTSVGERQPELLAFAMALSDELSDEARELAVYLFFVVHSIFRRGYGKPLPRISGEQIMRQHEATDRLMTSLLGKDDSALELAAIQETSRQPWVMKYIVEALEEAPEEEDPIQLSEEDFGEIFLMLKTVVDALDLATNES